MRVSMKVLFVLAACVYLTVADSDSCECGLKKRLKIIGGKETGPNDHPWMASIIKLDSSHECGASIITEWHAITAANCVDKSQAEDLNLLLGEYDLKKNPEHEPIPVSAIVVHEDYAADNQVHDIALVTSSKKIEFNSRIHPLCLPKEGVNLDNASVKVVGWGTTNTEGEGPFELLEIDQTAISLEQCQKQLDSSGTTVESAQLCVFSEVGNGACTGDSGGPVIWLNPEIQSYTLVGITTHSQGGCSTGTLPTVNTDVAHHMEWINKHVKETKPEATLCTGY